MACEVSVSFAWVSASPTNSQPLAFHETVDTPEQVQLHLELAGLGTRSIAFILDALVRYGLLVSLVVAVMLIFGLGLNWSFDSLAPSVGARVLIIGLILVYFAVEWAYFAVFEWLWNGQTPGKRAVHIRVLKDGGGPISFLDAALRNLLRPIDSSGPMCGFGILFIFFNSKHKRIGDLVARTIVVREHPKTVAEVLAPPVASAPRADNPFAELIRRIPLGATEHEMVVRYLQRRASLDSATRFRLAHQVAGVVIENAKAQAVGLDAPSPPPEQCERFLEDLIAFHQGQSGPPP
ncbi:MAG TPA: RDD family protein [Verrucomicrobiae bacterium]|nr:RDD family protein [Verrucomicrobiae bacterium]